MYLKHSYLPNKIKKERRQRLYFILFLSPSPSFFFLSFFSTMEDPYYTPLTSSTSLINYLFVGMCIFGYANYKFKDETKVLFVIFLFHRVFTIVYLSSDLPTSSP